MPPRKVAFSKLFLKTLAGLGVGIIGMLILLVFVFTSLGSLADTSVGTITEGIYTSPFLKFTVLTVAFAAAVITNSLALFVYGFIDGEKYNSVRWPMRQALTVNILIFILLLPVYLAVITTRETLLTIAILQIFLSAQASIFMLEFSAARETSDNLIALLGITFSMLFAIVLGIIIFTVGGSTAALMAILPIIWVVVGIILHATEMIYRWIYTTWGVEPLKKQDV